MAQRKTCVRPTLVGNSAFGGQSRKIGTPVAKRPRAVPHRIVNTQTINFADPTRDRRYGSTIGRTSTRIEMPARCSRSELIGFPSDGCNGSRDPSSVIRVIVCCASNNREELAASRRPKLGQNRRAGETRLVARTLRTLDLISFCHWCLTTITPSSDKFVPPTCGRLAPTSLLLLADYLWLLLLSRSQLLSEACSGQDHAHGGPREWPAPTA